MVGVGALVTSLAPLAGGVLPGGMAGRTGPSVPDLRAGLFRNSTYCSGFRKTRRPVEPISSA
jgi:hypothetical protein